MSAPWLTVAVPIQPSKSERMASLGVLLHQMTTYARHPDCIAWAIYPAEGAAWTVARKWCLAIEQATTEWVFLLADDVACLTLGWDDTLREASALDLDLIGVNDGIFRESIAVYPCVRRSVGLALIPSLSQYRYYRIDDHLTDVCRGAGRFGFMPHVKFHSAEHIAGTVYAPDPERFEVDNRTYRDLTDQRQQETEALSVKTLTQQVC
jgi:hypothetical protein